MSRSVMSGRGPMMTPPIILVPKAMFALRRLKNRLGLSTTDTVNRALQVYDVLEEEKGNGNRIFVGTTHEGLREVTWPD